MWVRRRKANTIEDKELIRLLNEGESDRVEFKESMGGKVPESIREAICAFSNDLAGRREPGVVFVGVRDDGRVAGISITDELIRRLADMKTDGNIVPPPSMIVERRNICGQNVAVITVHPSDSPPVRCRGIVHIRIGPRRGTATAQDERILNERRRYLDIPFDVHPVPSAALSDLNLTQFVNEYLAHAFARDVLDANERSLEEQLAATKMIASVDDPTVTVLGLLVLGKNPQDFLPGAYVQFLKLDGMQLSDDIVDSQDIRGSIPDVLRRLDEKITAHNRTTVNLTSGIVEDRIDLYPSEAIRQITSNAIMHRSYEATNAPVRVLWFDGRIEVISPGGPFGAVTDQNFGRPGVTDYRNPNLAEAMRTLGYVQRFGVGIPRARRLLIESGHPELEFDIEGNHVLARVKVAPPKDADMR